MNKTVNELYNSSPRAVINFSSSTCHAQRERESGGVIKHSLYRDSYLLCKDIVDITSQSNPMDGVDWMHVRT